MFEFTKTSQFINRITDSIIGNELVEEARTERDIAKLNTEQLRIIEEAGSVSVAKVNQGLALLAAMKSGKPIPKPE